LFDLFGSKKLSKLLRAIADRETADGDLKYLLSTLIKADRFKEIKKIMLSNEGVENELSLAMDLHLHLIHAARLKMIKLLLPPGEVILDLGGANAPLYRMGYPHSYKKLFLIDYPEDRRHESFKDVSLERMADGGEIILRYADMTDLSAFNDETVDFVWSGQSIEHVTQSNGIRMCAEVFRILKPGGSFCLDTPNRLITELHTRSIGGGYIHPDHKIEYMPKQLREILIATGFIIVSELGICDMPLTTMRGEFTYEDFVVGGAISLNLDRSYIQYYHCKK
jgi:predicted SAM-dependent methyltransferase